MALVWRRYRCWGSARRGVWVRRCQAWSRGTAQSQGEAAGFGSALGCGVWLGFGVQHWFQRRGSAWRRVLALGFGSASIFGVFGDALVLMVAFC